MPHQFFDNPNYRAEIRALLRLHQLWQEGRGDSAEADALRDATDGHWEALSEAERRRIWGLSQDLNSIENQSSHQHANALNPQLHAKLVEANEARKSGLWDRALELLRTIENDAPPALLSHLRGSIWLDAGNANVAVVFIENAARLEPDLSSYQSVILQDAAAPVGVADLG
jgi:hypothetical protein